LLRHYSYKRDVVRRDVIRRDRIERVGYYVFNHPGASHYPSLKRRGVPKKFPSCLRVIREFEEHASEPANDRRDATRLDGRGARASGRGGASTTGM